MIQPCVRSGFCCKKGPCPYGEVTSPTNPACRFLEVQEVITDGRESAEVYRCGRYEYIIQQPGNEFIPAFWSGLLHALVQ